MQIIRLCRWASIDLRWRKVFLWDVSLIFWEVVSVEFLHCSQDGLRNKALAAHFAIASWFGAVTQGHDTSNLRKALAADSSANGGVVLHRLPWLWG
jgi:hypothetical protein